MSQKNFVVSFLNIDDKTDVVLSGYNRQIMEIMMGIYNKSNDYNYAKENKHNFIREFLTLNKRDVEYIIYIYGIEKALTEYKENYNENVSIMLYDLAIMIIANIIVCMQNIFLCILKKKYDKQN